MNTFLHRYYRIIIMVVGALLIGICVLHGIATYREQRKLESTKENLIRYWKAACIHANTSSSGEFVADLRVLVAHDDLTAETAAELSESIILLENLSNVSTSTLPLAYSKASFGGKLAVIRISGEILLMTTDELRSAIERIPAPYRPSD